MPISFSCGQCGAEFTAPDDVAGKRAKCGACGGVTRIPSPQPPPAPIVIDAVAIAPPSIPAWPGPPAVQREVAQETAPPRERRAKVRRRALTITPILCVVAGYGLRWLTAPTITVADVDAEVRAALTRYDEIVAAEHAAKILQDAANVSQLQMQELSPRHAYVYGAGEQLLRDALVKSGFADGFFAVEEVVRFPAVVGWPPGRQPWLLRGTVNGEHFIAHAAHDILESSVSRPGNWKLHYIERRGKPFKNYQTPIPGLPVGVTP